MTTTQSYSQKSIAYYRVPNYKAETIDLVYAALEQQPSQHRIFDMRGAGSLNSYALAKIKQFALRPPRNQPMLTAVILDQHPTSRVTLIALQSLPLGPERLQIFYDPDDAKTWLQSKLD